MQKFSFGFCGRCVEQVIMLVAIVLIAASFSESRLMDMIVYACVFVYTNTDRRACSGGGSKGKRFCKSKYSCGLLNIYVCMIAISLLSIV